MSTSKNPKTLAGQHKVPLHLIPPSFMSYTAVGMADGEGKYGRNNFRETPMEASVLIGAVFRHLGLWFEGQEVASDSGVPHLANAAASLAILIDMHTHGTLIDDRNPNGFAALEALNAELCEALANLRAGREGKLKASRDFTLQCIPKGERGV